jgi:oxygen-independent coproporphyrinogen-3 oxidase
MDAKRTSRYDLRVPRYTSYPTAPHFSGAVGAAEYRAWLGELAPEGALSLYFHIPFCDSMCWFCGCYTKIVKRYAPVADYLASLHGEIELAAGVLPGRFPVSHLHWGGGSPTMLVPDDWMRIIEHIGEHYELLAGAEIAVELDPRDATEEYVKALAQAGVNRASIGQQDFHPEVQEAINRDQPAEVTDRVVGWLRKHCIDALNMDLMYGLPHQTTERVAEMVDIAVTFTPHRVALFGYAHVPWMKEHQKLIDEAALPGAEARWEQAAAAAARLMEHGYVRIGLDHFARPGDSLAEALADGRLKRNFQGYTVDEAPVLLGFGASAISSLPQGYTQNVQPLKTYGQHIADGRFPIHRGKALSDQDKLRAAVIERLMCYLAVDLAQVADETGVEEDFAAELEKLAPLAEDGICRIEGGRITVPEDCRALVRLVAAAFDTYLDPEAARHSRAV